MSYKRKVCTCKWWRGKAEREVCMCDKKYGMTSTSSISLVVVLKDVGQIQAVEEL